MAGTSSYQEGLYVRHGKNQIGNSAVEKYRKVWVVSWVFLHSQLQMGDVVQAAASARFLALWDLTAPLHSPLGTVSVNLYIFYTLGTQRRGRCNWNDESISDVFWNVQGILTYTYLHHVQRQCSTPTSLGSVSLPVLKQGLGFQSQVQRPCRHGITRRDKSPPPVLRTSLHHHCRDRRCNRLRPLCTRHLWNLPCISCKSWHTDPYPPSCIAGMPDVVLQACDLESCSLQQLNMMAKPKMHQPNSWQKQRKTKNCIICAGIGSKEW